MSDCVIATIVRIARGMTRKEQCLPPLEFHPRSDARAGVWAAPQRRTHDVEAPAQELDGAVLKIVVSGMVAFRCGE